MSADNRFSVLLILMGLALVLSVPELLPFFGAPPLGETLGWLGDALENHRFREITGFVILGLVAFELLLMAQKRTKWLHRIVRGNGHRWRLVHMCLGVAILPLVVAHTGGHWGKNLNGWLLTTCLLVIATALLGKAMESALLARMRRQPKPVKVASGTAAAPPVRRTKPWSIVIHRSWYRLHVLLVASLVVLLGFHIFSVYYF